MSMLSLILILVLKIILHIWNENTVKIIQKISPEFEYSLAILETQKPYGKIFPKQAQLLTALELEKKLFNASDPIIFDTPHARSRVSNKNTPAGFINNRKIEKI